MFPQKRLYKNKMVDKTKTNQNLFLKMFQKLKKKALAILSGRFWSRRLSGVPVTPHFLLAGSSRPAPCPLALAPWPLPPAPWPLPPVPHTSRVGINFQKKIPLKSC